MIYHDSVVNLLIYTPLPLRPAALAASGVYTVYQQIPHSHDKTITYKLVTRCILRQGVYKVVNFRQGLYTYMQNIKTEVSHGSYDIYYEQLVDMH